MHLKPNEAEAETELKPLFLQTCFPSCASSVGTGTPASLLPLHPGALHSASHFAPNPRHRHSSHLGPECVWGDFQGGRGGGEWTQS